MRWLFLFALIAAPASAEEMTANCGGMGGYILQYESMLRSGDMTPQSSSKMQEGLKSYYAAYVAMGCSKEELNQKLIHKGYPPIAEPGAQ